MTTDAKPIDDGGPAFPLAVDSPDQQYGHVGMSLRDYFAAQALAGQLAFSPQDSLDKAHQPGEVAEMCYRFSDAMIAERARGQG